MKVNRLFFLFAVAATTMALARPASALHEKIRVPMVSYVTVKDQSTQTAAVNFGWLNETLGLVSPPAYLDIAGDIGFYKKVQISFTLTHALASDYFAAKQQKEGFVSLMAPYSSLEQDSSWTQDGPFPYSASTYNIDNSKNIYMTDDPGLGAIATPNPDANYENIMGLHFRDKIKWLGPDGGYYDVYGPADPDPYFGYWQRYVAIWNAPGPPPNGTNNQWAVAAGGNY